MAGLTEKLRYKILGSLLAVLFLFILIAWFTLRYVEQPSFIEVEQLNASDQLERVQNIIASERQNLESWVADWGYWDDSWEFVAGEHESFYEDNLSEDYLGTLGLSFAVYLDQDLNIFWAEAYASENGSSMPIERVLSDDFFERQTALLPEAREDVVSGFVDTKAGPAILATHTLLKSSGYGSAGGYLVFGKLLDETNLAKIDRQLVTNIDLVPADPGMLEDDHWQAFGELDELKKPHAIVTHDNQIFALGMLRDLSDRPIGMLRVAMERDVTRLGKSTMQKSISLLVGSSVLIMLCLWFMLKKMIVTPTERLTRLVEIMRQEMIEDGSEKDLKNTTEALRLWRDTMSQSARRDEFGKLVHAFQLFSESLHKTEASTDETHSSSIDQSEK
jgi:sensor domain CHASE-containing protein